MPLRVDEEKVLAFLGAEVAGVQLLSDELLDPSTGLYGYSVVLKFLEFEFYRFESCGVPFSLVLFDMEPQHKDFHTTDVLTEAVNTVAPRLDLVLRKLDIAGHFEGNSYAIVLPGTRLAEAVLLASKCYKTLTAAALAKGLHRGSLKFAFGAAGLPDNGDSLQSVIAAAQAAKHHAASKKFPVFGFRGTT